MAPLNVIAAGVLFLVRPERIGQEAAEPVAPVAAPAPPRPGRMRRIWRVLSPALTVLAIAAWLVFLRPAALGGPASYVLVSGTSMEPSLANGDLVIARRQDSYAKGDVIVYRVPRGELGAGALVIHRITGGSARTGFITRGDNRRAIDQWRPKLEDVAGRQLTHLPAGGRVFSIIRQPLPLALLAATLTFLSVGNRPKRVEQSR